jgi:type III pantothenate kinase
LIALVKASGCDVQVLDHAQRLPLRIEVEQPERVGVDRLFNAVAANARRRPETAAVVVDAGSAVTVDWIDETGAFRGGAIFPGLRLMSQALHDYTALLPLVDEWPERPALPGTSTISAIQAGVFWAVAGGIQALAKQLGNETGSTPEFYLTGGDASFLEKALNQPTVVWPEMTLEGIRLSALAVP